MPLFFGHMSFNAKDPIIAFSHIWISYFLIRYLKKQNSNTKRNKYSIYLSLLAALATGIQLVFIGSLIPIFLFFILEIFLFKKFITKKFNIKSLVFDFFKSFLIFYFILILFWIDTHPNILILPYEFLLGTLSDDYWTGWQYNLINGEYFFSNKVKSS